MTYFRHAKYYESVTRQAGELYGEGGDSLNRGVALIVSEFANIQAGQSSAARFATDNPAAAKLTILYAEDLSGWKPRFRPHVDWVIDTLKSTAWAICPWPTATWGIPNGPLTTLNGN